MNKKIITSIILILSFVFLFFLTHTESEIKVVEVKSPNEIVLKNGNIFSFDEFETFDDYYSDKNKIFASAIGISEDEAFILGNFGKYWAKNILESRYIHLTKDDMLYYKFGYKARFENSAYCLKDGKPCLEFAFKKQLNTIRKGHFVMIDMDSDTIYPISKQNSANIKNFVIVRRTHVKTAHFEKTTTKENKMKPYPLSYKPIFENSNIKIIVSDLTTKLKPDRNCSSEICQEILSNINSTKSSLDIAIYGYSSTPDIEKALRSAISRGVKVRLVYDIDSKGNNIYPDTNKITSLILNNKSDKNSVESANTMHNKFYIFDNKVVITGSANLSHTDMSGYNTNSIIVLKSEKAAKMFTNEFEKMYSGNFHTAKSKTPSNILDNNTQIYFSPQDKSIKNALIPLIKNAKSYIYIPAFIITENDFTKELINAHNRGVDVKIIADALNASTKHSKHKELRNSGIQLKAENYAGKMHSKTIIIDDEYLVIGSMNFSYSGENRNDENLVLLKNSSAAKFYRDFFLYQWNKIPEKWLKLVPRAESKDSIGSCSDGLDNNYDGLTDLEDPACR